MEYCHVSWTEAWEMPVKYRQWLIRRKQKEVEKEQQAMEKAKKKGR